MTKIFAMPVETYAQRVQLIKKNDLALWDVLAACVRPGSLDSAIQPDSIRVNDFEAFFKKHSQISHVFFNGGTAESLFMRHVVKEMDAETRQRLTLQKLPSTSPAMASLDFSKKCAAWRVVRRAQGTRSGRAAGV